MALISFSRKSLLTALQALVVPSGAIMWFNRSTAPSGWVICDGNNGTPNLIGKYALGATSGIGDSVSAGLPKPSMSFSGSASSVSFSGTTSSNGSHTHSGLHKHAIRSGAGNDQWQCATPAQGISSDSSGSHKHTFSGSVSITPSGSVSVTTDGVYGKSSTVTPPSVKLLPCMKL